MITTLNAIGAFERSESSAPETKTLKALSELDKENLSFVKTILGKVGATLTSTEASNKMLAELKSRGDFDRFVNLVVPATEAHVDSPEKLKQYKESAGLTTRSGNCSRCWGFLRTAFAHVAAAVGRLAAQFLTATQEKIEGWKMRLEEFSKAQEGAASGRAKKGGRKPKNPKSPEDLLKAEAGESENPASEDVNAESENPASEDNAPAVGYSATKEDLQEITALKSEIAEAKEWIGVVSQSKNVLANLSRATNGRPEVINTLQLVDQEIEAIGAKIA